MVPIEKKPAPGDHESSLIIFMQDDPVPINAQLEMFCNTLSNIYSLQLNEKTVVTMNITRTLQ